jgi:hypothetical protein
MRRLEVMGRDQRLEHWEQLVQSHSQAQQVKRVGQLIGLPLQEQQV